MIVNSYSLLDTKTGLYSMPWFFAHDAQAMRAVNELARDKNTTVGNYPADYVLYRIGLFDDNTGECQTVAPYNMGSVAAISGALSE